MHLNYKITIYKRKILKKYEKEFAEELDKLPIERKKRILESSKAVDSILVSGNKSS